MLGGQGPHQRLRAFVGGKGAAGAPARQAIASGRGRRCRAAGDRGDDGPSATTALTTASSAINGTTSLRRSPSTGMTISRRKLTSGGRIGCRREGAAVPTPAPAPTSPEPCPSVGTKAVAPRDERLRHGSGMRAPTGSRKPRRRRRRELCYRGRLRLWLRGQ